MQQHVHMHQHHSLAVQLYALCLLTPLPQSPVDLKPHLLPFMLPGEETTELGALYQCVRRVMVGVHKNIEKVENLVHIADEW